MNICIAHKRFVCFFINKAIILQLEVGNTFSKYIGTNYCRKMNDLYIILYILVNLIIVTSYITNFYTALLRGKLFKNVFNIFHFRLMCI